MNHRSALLYVVALLFTTALCPGQSYLWGVNWSLYDADTSHAQKLSQTLGFNAFHFTAGNNSVRTIADSWKQHTNGTMIIDPGEHVSAYAQAQMMKFQAANQGKFTSFDQDRRFFFDSIGHTSWGIDTSTFWKLPQGASSQTQSVLESPQAFDSWKFERGYVRLAARLHVSSVSASHDTLITIALYAKWWDSCAWHYSTAPLVSFTIPWDSMNAAYTDQTIVSAPLWLHGIHGGHVAEGSGIDVRVTSKFLTNIYIDYVAVMDTVGYNFFGMARIEYSRFASDSPRHEYVTRC